MTPFYRGRLPAREKMSQIIVFESESNCRDWTGRGRDARKITEISIARNVALKKHAVMHG